MAPRLPLASRRVRRALVVLWAGYVLVASTVDPPSGGLPPIGPLGLVGLDKWLHALAYAAMALLVAYALAARTPRTLALAVALTAAYGAGIEAVQAFLPLRAFDPADALANAAGAALGAAAWSALTRIVPLPADRGGFTGASDSEG
ncbi:VanZ family protein [Halomarina halobia]|uniref:VanZ family protein n=1 Tax=Halomarina halobia TaxID=3033386 RepID=A0ABD6A7P9_9EURY|nr:VanZ family protein [Halomarina sp. PSR21]